MSFTCERCCEYQKPRKPAFIIPVKIKEAVYENVYYSFNNRGVKQARSYTTYGYQIVEEMMLCELCQEAAMVDLKFLIQELRRSRMQVDPLFHSDISPHLLDQINRQRSVDAFASIESIDDFRYF